MFSTKLLLNCCNEYPLTPLSDEVAPFDTAKTDKGTLLILKIAGVTGVLQIYVTSYRNQGEEDEEDKEDSLNHELDAGLAETFCGLFHLKIQEVLIHLRLLVVPNWLSSQPLFLVLHTNLINTEILIIIWLVVEGHKLPP